VALLFALILDHLLGEPPVRFHPVVWMGRYLGWALRKLPAGNRQAFRSGAILWLLGATAAASVGIVLHRAVAVLPSFAVAGLEGFLLWPLLSLRLLTQEVAGVESALGEGIEAGRERLSRIVSRDTTHLTPGEVRESALESLSENLTDSVTAPLFWFLLGGLPGALVYRFANTADAMWGYRDHREWFGKFAAHADDALNWIPARLTGLLLCPSRLWGRLEEESHRTPSPNGGWTMGALALRLGVRLGKPGVYTLNPDGLEPEAEHTRIAIAACRRVAWIAAAVLAVLWWCFHA